MATFYKVSIHGTANAQEITNVLYLGNRDGTDVDTSIDQLNLIHETFVADIQAQFLACLSSQYSLNRMVITIVDGNNAVVGNFPYEKELDGAGLRSGATGGAHNTAILALKCIPFASGSPRVPKRSYLAVGPMNETDVTDTQELGAQIKGVIANLGEALMGWGDLTSLFGTIETPWQSVRVGTPNAAGVGSYGNLFSYAVRPYASVRRSRMIKPNGG